MVKNTVTAGNGKDKFHGWDILDASQFSKKDLDIVIARAEKMKKTVRQKGGSNVLQGKIMSALFYEPSSRTFGSFVAAMQRLGGGFIPLQGMGNSSAAKGETLEDTIKTFASYSDVIVMRHPEVGSTKRAADATTVPVINAGDGIGEHPTQALLDLYTIKESLEKTHGLHVVFFGELGRYRPVNSLAKLLALYPNNRITFVSPPQGVINPKLQEYLTEKGIAFTETDTIDKVIGSADVLYVTRIKKEFMPQALYKKLKGKYVVDAKILSRMKGKSIVMHALPRIDEIVIEVDNDPRAVYLRSQVQNGMCVRMALLALVLGKV